MTRHQPHLFLASLLSSRARSVEIQSESHLYPFNPLASSVTKLPTSACSATLGFQNMSEFWQHTHNHKGVTFWEHMSALWSWDLLHAQCCLSLWEKQNNICLHQKVDLLCFNVTLARQECCLSPYLIQLFFASVDSNNLWPPVQCPSISQSEVTYSSWRQDNGFKMKDRPGK